MPAEDLDQGEGGLEGAISRPLTRSSLKPRLLFPVAKPTQPTLTETDSQVSREDEEAATDIEDHVLADYKAKEKEKATAIASSAKESKDAGPDPGPGPATPADLVPSPSQAPDPPEPPRFAPTSPPATATTASGRVTRFSSAKGATVMSATGTAAATATTAGSTKKPATKKRSPFDGWRRVKGGAHASTSAAGGASGAGAQKRPGEELPAMVNPPPKRTRA